MFPNELYHYIFQFCEYSTLVCLEQCCNNFKLIVDSTSFKFNGVSFNYYKCKRSYYNKFKSLMLSNDCKKIEIKEGHDVKLELFDNAFASTVLPMVALGIFMNYSVTTKLHTTDTSIIKVSNEQDICFISDSHYHKPFDGTRVVCCICDFELIKLDEVDSLQYIFCTRCYIYVIYASYRNNKYRIVKYNLEGIKVYDGYLDTLINKLIVGTLTKFMYDNGFLIVHKMDLLDKEKNQLFVFDLSTMKLIHTMIIMDSLVQLCIDMTIHVNNPVVNYPYLISHKKNDNSYNIQIINIMNNLKNNFDIALNDYIILKSKGSLYFYRELFSIVYNDILFVVLNNILYLYDLKIHEPIKKFTFDDCILDIKINDKLILILFYNNENQYVRVYNNIPKI